MNLVRHQQLSISTEEMQGQAYIKEVWKGILSEKVFKKLIIESLAIYERKLPEIIADAPKFFLCADITGITMIRDEEIQWLEAEINPVYERLGFTHQGIVMPKSFFAGNVVKNYEGVSPSGRFTTNLFEDELSALRWFFKK